MTFVLEQRGLLCCYNVIIERITRGKKERSPILRGATVYQKIPYLAGGESVTETGGSSHLKGTLQCLGK